MRQAEKEKRSNSERPEDLDSELLNKEVEIALQTYGSLRGKIAGISRYWIKLEFSGRYIYINKPFIVFIRPIQ
jgi:hypothetical protein